MREALAKILHDRRWRVAGAVVVAGLVCFIVAGVAVLAALDRGALDRPLARGASKALERPVAFTSVRTRLLSARPSLVVTGLRLGNPAWAGPGEVLTARRVELAFRWSRLLHSDLNPVTVAVDEPVAHLIRASRQQKNWTSGKSGGTGVGSVLSLRITGGRFTYEDRVRDMTLSGLADYDAARGERPLQGRAEGVLKGEAVSLTLRGAPLTGRKPRTPYPFDVRVQDGETLVVASGTSAAPLSLRGFDLEVQASGPNLAEMKYLIGVGLPNSRPYRLTGHLARQGRTTPATGLRAVIGESDFAGTIVSDGSKPRRMLRIDLTSKVLHAADIAAFLTHIPDHAHTRSVPGSAGKGGSDRLLGSKPLNLVRFRDRDARLSIAADRFMVGHLATSRLRTQGVLDHGVFNLKPFSLALPSGAAQGALSMDVNGPNPAFGLEGTVRGDLATLMPGLAETITGRSTLTVDIAGAGPSWRAIGQAAKGAARLVVRDGDIQKSKAKVLSGAVVSGALTALTSKNARTPLPCAVAEATIGGGQVRSRRIVLATGSGFAMAVGRIDLASETIDLTVYGQPRGGLKLFTSDKPVAVRGRLLSPKVDVLPKGGPSAPAPEAPGMDDPAAFCASLG